MVPAIIGFRAEQHVKLFHSSQTTLLIMSINDTVPASSVGDFGAKPVLESTQNPTTKFADDSIGYEATIELRRDTDPYSSFIIAPSSQTIIDFLRRPSIITSANFTVSDSGILYAADITSLITSHKQNRMSNIYTYRADFQLTLQVNADRFQQGRYILFFLPNGGVLGPSNNGNNLLWRNMHTCNLTKITQLPHVEIDLATQTHVSLDIPYSSIYPMLTWSTASGSSVQGMGLFGIIPYSPLNAGSGGSATCGYTLFGSLTNVKIGSASVNQAGVSDEEATAQGQGPISRALERVSHTASIWGNVPIIGSYARNLNWFSKLAAKSASIWGFSKPISVAAPMRMDRKTTPYLAVSDVMSMAKPLGVLSENSVVVPSSIPTNLDEMDFSFIIKHYAYLSRYTWSTSDTTGTVITSVNVQPQGYTTWSKGQVHTPLSFTANQFFRYRGSIKYRFKLVKTSFHRGRLAVAFYPGTTGTYPALSSSEYVFREIVDVSQTSSFEVCCPYLVSSPWSNLGTRIGILVVYVLDPLVAPTTVSTSVDILMEVAGGDDMQFSVPTNWQYEPYAPSTAQAGVESYEETPCFSLGPSISSVTDRLNTETSGESIKSLRQIIKRVFHYNSQAILIGGPGYSQIYPYAVTPVMQAATTSGVLFRDTLFSDIINLWQCAYAFSYGSLLYTFRPPGGVSPTGGDQTYVVESAAQAGLITQTGLYVGSGYSPTGALTYNTLKIEGPVELRSPNWNSGLGRSVPAQFCNGANLVSMIEPSANCTNILLGDSQAVASYRLGIARSAADDFGFGMFVGVPPVVAYTTT